MIRHCVLIRFLPTISQQARQQLYDKIAVLQNHLPGWIGFVAGENITPEIGMDKGYNGGFIIDFESEAARDAYLHDAEHKAVGQQIIAAASDGIEGVMVFDLWI